MSQPIGLRMVATLEAFKGVLAVMVALGIHSLFQHDAQQVIIRLIERCHLNPASYYPHLLIEKVGEISPQNISLLTIGILAYSLIRFIESYGLWQAKLWTEWFALVSGAIYIPFELYELAKQVDILTVGTLCINVMVVGYMAFLLKSKRNA